MDHRLENIGPRGRWQRLLLGVAMLAVGFLLLGGLLWTGADRGWRGTLVLPFWIAALGLSQARAHT
ncbi:MAG: hypothetical protein HY727_02880 [Candidatus Rokubacteria bacterium]|nr:hypothetical protein [Candidatus Rokubacteria bacterium]